MFTFAPEVMVQNVYVRKIIKAVEDILGASLKIRGLGLDRNSYKLSFPLSLKFVGKKHNLGYVWNAHFENCVHFNQSVITVHAFGGANVIVCYAWLITSHLKFDVIVCYIWLIPSHLKYDVIGFMCGSYIQLTKLVLFFSI